MIRKSLAAAMLVLLAGAGWARADEPLAVPSNIAAPTITLEGDGQAATDNVHFFRRHYYGYYRPSYYYSYSYYRPYYSYSYYRPYYNYYRPYYGYYRRPYVSFSYGYYPSYYGGYGYYGGYCGINGDESDANLPATPLGAFLATPDVNPTPADSKAYQYDGGPAVTVPEPQGTPNVNPPAPEAPLQGHLVSIPGQSQPSGFTFPAYGAQPTETNSTPAAPSTGSGFAFPAYGQSSGNSGFAVDQR